MVRSVESIISSDLLDVSGDEMTIRNTLRPAALENIHHQRFDQ